MTTPAVVEATAEPTAGLVLHDLTQHQGCCPRCAAILEQAALFVAHVGPLVAGASQALEEGGLTGLLMAMKAAM